MIHQAFRRAAALATLAVVVLLTGCASPANRDAMTAASIASSKKLPYSLSVKTGGGNETLRVLQRGDALLDRRVAGEQLAHARGDAHRLQALRQFAGDHAAQALPAR
jgi:hypothetical protein